MEMCQMKKIGVKLFALLLMFSGTLLCVREVRFALTVDGKERYGVIGLYEDCTTKTFVYEVRGYAKKYIQNIDAYQLVIDGKPVPENDENFWKRFPSFNVLSKFEAVKRVKQEAVKEGLSLCFTISIQQSSDPLICWLFIAKDLTNKGFLELLGGYAKKKFGIDDFCKKYFVIGQTGIVPEDDGNFITQCRLCSLSSRSTLFWRVFAKKHVKEDSSIREKVHEIIRKNVKKNVVRFMFKFDWLPNKELPVQLTFLTKKFTNDDLIFALSSYVRGKWGNDNDSGDIYKCDFTYFCAGPEQSCETTSTIAEKVHAGLSDLAKNTQ